MQVKKIEAGEVEPPPITLPEDADGSDDDEDIDDNLNEGERA